MKFLCWLFGHQVLEWETVEGGKPCGELWGTPDVICGYCERCFRHIYR